MTKDKNGKNVPYLELMEVILILLNIFNNYYQENSKALYKFVTNKYFGQLFLPKISYS